MRLPWVSRSKLDLVKAAGDVACKIAESQNLQLAALREEIGALQKALGAARTEAEDWAKKYRDVDDANRNLVAADPVRVYAQDGPDGQAVVNVTCRVDRRRMLRKPDRVFDAFGRRVGAELNAKFKALLEELRANESARQAAETYQEA